MYTLEDTKNYDRGTVFWVCHNDWWFTAQYLGELNGLHGYVDREAPCNIFYTKLPVNQVDQPLVIDITLVISEINETEKELVKKYPDMGKKWDVVLTEEEYGEVMKDRDYSGNTDLKELLKKFRGDGE